jgi:hypothetical protein
MRMRVIIVSPWPENKTDRCEEESTEEHPQSMFGLTDPVVAASELETDNI